ncbi:MAG: hypothetical protein IKB46_02925 [Paludibacteraceae bacterium]|nr:hypothetical protein [Paludibacteraceae bacterium]
MNILTLKSKMYAQNPCHAYILCSIIIETRPTEDTKSLTRGDTAVIIQTKTIKPYNAKKN